MNQKPLFALLICLAVNACAVETADPMPLSEPTHQQASATCRNALSATEEKTALKLIDDICGDTWCEGDNNFAFDHLTCRAGAPASPASGTCTLAFRILPRDDTGHAFSRRCTTGNFAGFASLVETAPNGYQSLNWDYYLALTDCIAELEATLRR